MPWTINSEIYPLWARSTGCGAATFTNWAFNLLISMSFLSLTDSLTRFGKKTCSVINNFRSKASLKIADKTKGNPSNVSDWSVVAMESSVHFEKNR